MQTVAIPKLIDAPAQIALWEMDDIGPIILMIGVGAMAKHMIPCMLLGLVLSKVYARFKLRTSRGALIYWAHWNGFMGLGAFKNGLARHYIGW